MISVITTVFNRELYLPQTIESVLLQTEDDFEYLIYDDGSTDKSLEIAQEYESRDNRIRVVSKLNLGQGEALKQAIAMTSGEYLCWVDSDDMLMPSALELTKGVLEQHEAIGVVYTDYGVINAEGSYQGLGYRCQVPWYPNALLTDFISFHFRLIRRDAYDLVGGINPSYDSIEDYELCLRLSEITDFYHFITGDIIRDPLYLYRVHPDSTSELNSAKQAILTYQAIELALVRRGLRDEMRVKLIPKFQLVSQ